MTVIEAQTLYLALLQSQYLSSHTIRKYRIHCRQLAAWAKSQKLDLEKITKSHLQTFMAQRTTPEGEKISQNTARNETQFHKTFFAWCEEAGLVPASPARTLKLPRSRPAEKSPFTQEEIIAILSAAGRLPASPYAKLRAKAAILVMWQHGLRISDTIGLRRDAISQVAGEWRLRLHTKKTGAGIDHPVTSVVLEALGNLPVPYGTRTHTHFFWNGRGSPGSTLTNMEKLLHEVYLLSGVKGAHNHRFRHTFCSELLAKGCDIPKLAYLMGISVVVALKTYGHLTREFQQGADAAMSRIGTSQKYQDVPSEAHARTTIL